MSNQGKRLLALSPFWAFIILSIVLLIMYFFSPSPDILDDILLFLAFGGFIIFALLIIAGFLAIRGYKSNNDFLIKTAFFISLIDLIFGLLNIIKSFPFFKELRVFSFLKN